MEYFRASVQNIATHGDTDIFPFPLENLIFFDNEAETIDLLVNIHKDFTTFLQDTPPLYENNLATVGYNGFRWATQIDPIWNAYLLGLVISIGDDIEKARIPASNNTVFTYRFKFDKDSKDMFDPNWGWREFQKTSREYAEKNKYVLICDIADFYPRVYHHRLENALRKATNNKDTVQRIMQLLSKLSDGVSFGLPVGGPAARLLSELLLNRTDRLMLTNDITFCRFADDYHVFTATEEEAYADLVFINSKLLENEGLSLQKSKTRIMKSEEFLSSSGTEEFKEPTDPQQTDSQKLLSLSLRYDPYSPTAKEDYSKLKDELGKFDIVGMLAREMTKTRVHQALTRKLITSIRYLSPLNRNAAIKSLVDNFSLLYPVFPNVMLLAKNLLPEMEGDTRHYIFDKTRELINSGSHIIKVPINLDYALRVLTEDPSVETDELLVKIYKGTDRMIVRRDIILIMAKRNADYWVSDVRKTFRSLDAWERRSLIVASFILEDEGNFWRPKIQKELSPLDKLVLDWAAQKIKSFKNIPI